MANELDHDVAELRAIRAGKYPTAQPVNNSVDPAIAELRALRTQATESQPSQSTLDSAKDFWKFATSQPIDAAEAFGHHLGNFVHGTAGLIENGLAVGAEKIAPGSSAAVALRNNANQTNAAMDERENTYQSGVPDSPGSYAGATLGTVAPFIFGGGTGSVSGAARIVGDTAAKVPEYIGAKMGQYGKIAGDAVGKVVTGVTQGGLFGATAPITGDGDYWDRVTNNVKAGSIFGGGLSGVGQAIKGGVNTASLVLGPLTESGQDSRVGKFLMDNLSDPNGAPAKLQSIIEYLKGSTPTTAQQLRDSRLLSVERAAKNTQPFGTAFDDLARKNNSVRVNALDELAGANGSYSDVQKTRSAAAAKLYGDAISEGIDQKALTPEIQSRIDGLLTRPSMKTAMADATKNAKESGISLPDGLSLQQLDFAKKNLGDQIESQIRAGNKDAARLLMGTKNELDELMATVSPKYAQAKGTFAALSKPINQMEQVQKITGKLETAPEDVSGIPQLTRAKYATALRQVDPSVMTLDQMAQLQAIKADLNRADLTNTAQRAVGSNTPQDLTNLDLINNLLGKSTVLQKIPGIASIGKTWTENASNSMQKKLADALINPKQASIVIQRALDSNANPGLIKALLGDPATAALLRNSPQYAASIVNR